MRSHRIDYDHDKHNLYDIHNKSGFTLTELLISIGISAVILAALVELFSINYASFILQEDVAAMQQNIRAAKIFLERDVLMAGSGISGGFGLYGTKVRPITFTNGGGDDFTDILTISYLKLSSGKCSDVLPQLTLASDNKDPDHPDMPLNSAESTVKETLTVDPYSKWDKEFKCEPNTYGGTPFKEFKAIITSPDGKKSDVVFITQVQANSDKLQNRPYAGFDNKIINSYPAGSTISFFSDDQLTQATYRYRASDRSLLRNGQPVATYLEDLQFAFGLDTDEDGTVETWVNNRDLTDDELRYIRTVRINIVGRTERIHRGIRDTRPAIEDRSGATTSDQYVREVIQLTVKVRNMGLK